MRSGSRSDASEHTKYCCSFNLELKYRRIPKETTPESKVNFGGYLRKSESNDSPQSNDHPKERSILEAKGRLFCFRCGVFLNVP